MRFSFYILLGINLIMGGCSSLSDPEIIVKTNTSKRPPKPDYMPPEEKPLESPSPRKIPVPIAPQVGIRIPLGK